MLVSELISYLQDHLEENGDMPVMASCDYGDYCHTEQLITIDSIESCNPIESAYSSSGLAFPKDDDDDDEEFDYEEKKHKDHNDSSNVVLVLRG